MNAVHRFAFTHLRSFRREGGPPYDQYAWAYSQVYRTTMLVIHRLGRHRYRKRMGGWYCSWCGAHAAD